MSRLPLRPVAVLCLLAGIQAPLFGQSAIPDQMDGWYTEAQRRAPGTWGVVVADDQGKVLWSVNGDQPMTPASTVKVLTTGFARSRVGGEARRPTRVTGSGSVDPRDGTWTGTWSLELNGDPTLERPDVGGPTLAGLANQLRAIGVQRLVGPLKLSSLEPSTRTAYPAAWDGRHRGRYFAPPVGPVTLNENLVAFTLAPGEKVGAAPRLISQLPGGVSAMVKVDARTVSGRTNRLVIRASGGGWVVTGTIGNRAASRRYVFVAHDPVALVTAVWQAALDSAGIVWDRTATPAPATGALRILAEVASPTFDAVAAEVNRRSVNIGAELMLAWGSDTGNAARQLERHVREVTGITSGISLHDGSGLSDNDKVTPEVFTTYLARFPRTDAGRDFPFLLPANGSGTLRSLASGLPERGVVRAKTGSLNRTTTLVGYLGRPDGVLVVAAMYNGTHTTNARQAQWELFRSLGADGVVIPQMTDDDVEVTFGSGPVETR